MATDEVLMGTVAMFGDSITQQAWSVGGTGAALANAYQRKLDVLNRGLGGYTTRWGLPIAKQWLPRAGGTQPKIALLTIWFGANDACLPSSPQHVPIEEFKANLHTICSLISDPSSIYYSPSTKIVLITPPPVDAIVRAKDLASRTPALVPDREYERTHQFAEAVKEVAGERGLPSVDVWTAIADAAARDGGLERYLSDGLHLTAEGYAIVTNEITRTILEQLPELHWDNIPMVFPGWADIVNNGALGPEFKV